MVCDILPTRIHSRAPASNNGVFVSCSHSHFIHLHRVADKVTSFNSRPIYRSSHTHTVRCTSCKVFDHDILITVQRIKLVTRVHILHLISRQQVVRYYPWNLQPVQFVFIARDQNQHVTPGYTHTNTYAQTRAQIHANIDVKHVRYCYVCTERVRAISCKTRDCFVTSGAGRMPPHTRYIVVRSHSSTPHNSSLSEKSSTVVRIKEVSQQINSPGQKLRTPAFFRFYRSRNLH